MEIIRKEELQEMINIIQKNPYGKFLISGVAGSGKTFLLNILGKVLQESGKEVKYKIAPRRSGDIAKCYADPAKAKIELGWVAEKNLDDMCKDSWHYIEMSQNQ